MKIILAGIAAAIVLGVIVSLVLPMAGEPAYQAYSTSSARVGEPGQNLIGGAWPDSKPAETGG